MAWPLQFGFCERFPTSKIWKTKKVPICDGKRPIPSIFSVVFQTLFSWVGMIPGLTLARYTRNANPPIFLIEGVLQRKIYPILILVNYNYVINLISFSRYMFRFLTWSSWDITWCGGLRLSPCWDCIFTFSINLQVAILQILDFHWLLHELLSADSWPITKRIVYD